MSDSSERPELAQLAVEELLAAPLATRLPSSGVRDRALAAMLEAAERVRARRRRRSLLAALAAAAAVLAVVGGAGVRALHRGVTVPHAPATEPALVTANLHDVGGAIVVEHDHRPDQPAIDGAAVVSGDRLIAAADGRAALALSTGTRLSLQPQADVTIVSAASDQVFELRAGSVGFDVAKLHTGERFIVRTLDAEVEVRGTSFVVGLVAPEAGCANGSPTRVSVREGVVVVRQGGEETRVAGGQAWPAGCPAATAASAPAPAVALPKAKSASVAAGLATATASAATATPKALASDLAAQNELYLEAMGAKQRGDRGTALGLLAKLLAEHPGGPLTENAMAERVRLSSGPAAVVAAKAYLAHYPGGFASAEAKRLLTPTP